MSAPSVMPKTKLIIIVTNKHVYNKLVCLLLFEPNVITN